MTTQILTDLARNGGGFDMLLKNGSTWVGFRYADPLVTQQITNLAPTFAVGGSGAFNTEAFQALPWPGTSNGGDKDVFESGDLRYSWSDGQVSTQGGQYLTLASKWNSWDAGQVATCRKIIDFPVGNGFVLVGVGKKLRAYNTTTQAWGNQGTFTNNAIDIATDQKFVFVAVGATEAYWRWNGTTWAQPAANTYANCFCVYNKTVCRAIGQNLFVSTDAGASARGWGLAKPVGWAITNINYLTVIGGVLFIGKPEGWWTYDGTNLKPLLNTENTADTANFVGGVEFQGVAYWPQKNQIMKGAIGAGPVLQNVSPIAPRMVGTNIKERYWHGFPRIMVPGPDSLFVAFDDGEGLYPEVLMYNGIGWHQVYRGASGDTMVAMGYSTLLGFLIINDGATRYKRIANIGSSEYPDYATTGDVISPKFDGGYPSMPKLWNSVLLYLDGMDAANSVAVKYILDGASAVTAATLSNVNGWVEVILGSDLGQVKGTDLQIELVLTRDAADVTDTPRVKWPVVPYGLPAPKATDAHRCSVTIDDRQGLVIRGYGKQADYLSTTGYKEFLNDCRESTNTLVLVDQYDTWQEVRLTNVSYARTPISISTKNQGKINREVATGDLSFINCFPGATRSVENPITVSATTGTET